MRSTIRGLALAALVSLALAAAGDGAGAPAAARGWPMKQEGTYLVVDTPHYQVKTDHAADVAQLLASHQETLFQELYRRMAGTRPVAQIQRMQVFVFRTKEAYEEVMGKEARGSQGMFSPDRISGYGAADAMDSLFRTLRHEGTHQFVNQFVGPKCPAWLNEGLAEYFQLGEFRNGQLQTGQTPLALVAELKQALNEGKHIPLVKMLTMSVLEWNAAVKVESPQAKLQYLEAWSMVHFLEGGEGGKYRGPLLQYIYFLSRNTPPQDAWARSFGGDVAGFEKRWAAYLKGLSPAAAMACTDKIGFLVKWVVALYQKPDVLKDIQTFRQAAIDGKLGGWEGTWADGTKLEIKDPETIKALFRCPEDKTAGDASSYELAPGKEGEPPALRCRHHIGFYYETAYAKDKDKGAWNITIASRPSLPGAAPPADKAKPAAAAPGTPTRNAP